jgi:hypothetical protein
MLRIAEDLPHRPLLHELALVHDRDAVRHLRDDAEVVRDEQQRQVEARLQFAHQVEHLCLDRDVERRRRLVGDDERRPAGERDGDHHALTHAAGELVRVIARAAGGVGDADRFEEFDGPRVGIRAAGAVDDQRFGDLVADAHDRIERGHRLLEDERDPRAPHLAHLAFRERKEVLAFEENRAAGDAAGRLEQPQDGKRGHRLPAARLAHEAERFARRHLKADVVHRCDRRTGAGEGHRQVLNVKERRVHRHRALSPRNDTGPGFTQSEK